MDGQQRSRPRSRFARLFAAGGSLMLTVVALGLLAFTAGFVWFVRHVPEQEGRVTQEADGIVVLTGGTSRIADGVELLAAGHAKRLLITGAHPTTTSKEISRLMPRYERWITCCVDLDHSALNTFGNAAETRRWLMSRSFESLIVVTSNYHMPRTMAELEHQLPDVKLIPHPVVSDKLRTEPWWNSIATAKLLLSEYVKYTVVQIRVRFEPAPAATGVMRSAKN
jgi:uncharacterized SAM-binding protein YcdF (DUF218 family)